MLGPALAVALLRVHPEPPLPGPAEKTPARRRRGRRPRSQVAGGVDAPAALEDKAPAVVRRAAHDVGRHVPTPHGDAHVGARRATGEVQGTAHEAPRHLDAPGGTPGGAVPVDVAFRKYLVEGCAMVDADDTPRAVGVRLQDGSIAEEDQLARVLPSPPGVPRCPITAGALLEAKRPADT